jgi:hypothetical protein
MPSIRIVRNTGIAALSAFVILAAAVFATATPSVELLANVTYAFTASGQHIRGRAVGSNGGPLKGGVVELTRTVHHKQVIVAKATIGSNGRFRFTRRIPDGRYHLVVIRGAHKATRSLRITSRAEIFILVEQKIVSGHSIIGPVIFNY